MNEFWIEVAALGEEEQLVTDKGAAQRASELIVVIVRIRSSRRFRQRGIDDTAAVILVAAAVQEIRTPTWSKR